MNDVKKITSESEYRAAMAAIEALTEKGTQLGDMELLSERDRGEYKRVAELAHEWESVYYPLPVVVAPIAPKRMTLSHLKLHKLNVYADMMLEDA